MKQVNEMPIEGQFVAIWINENGVWSDTLMYEDGVLHVYNNQEDSWDSYDTSYLVEGRNHSFTYFVED